MPPTPDYPRDLNDRVFRQILSEPLNVAAFLRHALPELADRFDCAHMEILPRTFLLDDWRDRECDLLLKMPFRASDQETKTVGVCLLLEHQTKTDDRMPLRMLHYMVEFWIRELRAWTRDDEEAATPFRMTPVVPIVLYAATREWGSNRTIAQMLGEPSILHSFAPQWGPLFWELGNQTVAELRQSHAGFDQFLALVRADDLPLAEYEPLFREVFTGLYQQDGNRVYLTELLNMLFAWASWNRPNRELKTWETIVNQTVADTAEQARIKAMHESALQTLLERVGNEKKNEGRNEGIEIGRDEGIEIGELRRARKHLLRMGRKRAGEPTPAQLQQIEECNDLRILDAWDEKASLLTSWDEILQPLNNDSSTP